MAEITGTTGDGLARIRVERRPGLSGDLELRMLVTGHDPAGHLVSVEVVLSDRESSRLADALRGPKT